MASWDENKQKFKLKAIRTWLMQPATGKIPDIGPRPKTHWASLAFQNSMGMFQMFMSMTLSRFYRGSTPDWAKRAWDIQLTVTNAGGTSDPKEISYCIVVKINPQL